MLLRNRNIYLNANQEPYYQSVMGGISSPSTTRAHVVHTTSHFAGFLRSLKIENLRACSRPLPTRRTSAWGIPSCGNVLWKGRASQTVRKLVGQLFARITWSAWFFCFHFKPFFFVPSIKFHTAFTNLQLHELGKKNQFRNTWNLLLMPAPNRCAPASARTR